MFFALTNSQHYLKNVMLDSQGHAFISRGSVFSSFSLSNPAIASLSELLPPSLEEKVVGGILVDAERLQKRVLTINDKPGTLKIRCDTSGYNSGLVDTK